jgi:hypothetical protein
MDRQFADVVPVDDILGYLGGLNATEESADA